MAFICTLTLVSTEKFRYDNFHVITVSIQDEQQQKIVEQLDASVDGMQLIDGIALNKNVTFAVSPNKLVDVKVLLSNEDLIPHVVTTNLQKYIDTCLLNRIHFTYNFNRTFV